MVPQRRGHPVLPPLHATTDKNTTPAPTTTTRKISGVLALESQNLARSSVVTKWMGDRYVVGLICTRPEISAESNSMISAVKFYDFCRVKFYADSTSPSDEIIYRCLPCVRMEKDPIDTLQIS